MKTLRLLPFFLILQTTAFSQIGKDGNVTITNTQVVNEYTFLNSNAAPGDMVLTVNNSGLNSSGTFSGPLEPGDLLMIIQMQGASILGGVNNINWGNILSYNNCGLFEFKEVADVPNGTHIELTCPVENAYTQSGHVQVIRVPRYNTLTVDGGTITALPWNGTRGGVVAIEVNGLTSLINGGTIDVTGQGFRGGILDNQTSYAQMNYAYPNQNGGGDKGESIAGFGPDYSPLGGRYGRGAPANGGGGGNAHNAGGGGGANAGIEIPWNGLGNPDNSNPAWSAAWNLEGGGFSGNLSSGGGRGGYTFSANNQNALVTGTSDPLWGGDGRNNTGGVGGRPLDYSTGRLFMGGGGGAGDGNNGAGTNGASGGGLVYLMTYSDVVGTGQIVASGQTAPTTPPAGNDAPGGGGGGGTIVVASNGTIAGSISLLANGGDGGDQYILSNEAEGPGGGGGGGYIAWSNGTPSTNVSGGANGTTNSLGVTEFPPNGATAGGDGLVSFPITSPYNMTIAAVDDTVCIGNSTTLNANAENPAVNSQIQWLDAPYGGNLLATGATFTTPNLFMTTTYYLKVCPSLAVDSVTVVVEANPVFAVVTDSTSCFNGSDGSAQINAMSNSYSYTWSNAATGPVVSGLTAGNYSVMATTLGGCTATVNFIVAQPAPININFSGTPALCFNDASGSLTATASGGASPFNYQWISPAVNGQTIANVPNGNYTVLVTDAEGCQAAANGSVSSPLPLVVNIASLEDVNCNGGSDGSVLVNIAGGTGPYAIDWLSLSTDSVFINNLAAGNYVAEINDAHNCEATIVATIAEPAPFTANFVVIADETCSDANGIALISVSGGIGVLDYTWIPNVSSTNVATNLSAGTLQVIVQDENGCLATDSGNIINHATGTGSIASLSPVSCANGSDGSIAVTMSGGTSPFHYSWSCACPDSPTISGLTEGIYTVNITDAYGCVETLNAVVNELPELVLNTVSVTEPLCFGDQNGEAVVEATGGTGPFFFAWNTMPAQLSDMASGLAAGTYAVVVTDANNCHDTLNVTLNQPAPLQVQTQVLSNILCFGDSAGVAEALANGGSLPYQYEWSTGSVNDTAFNLIAGTYWVEVTDDHGCKASAFANVVEYQSVVAEIIANPVFCPGDLVTFYVATNGMNNLYDYNWYVNGNLQSTQNTYTIPVYNSAEIAIELVNQVNCPNIQDTLWVNPIQPDPSILSMAGTTDSICFGSAGIIQALINDWTYVSDVYWLDLNLTGTGPHSVTPSEDTWYTVVVENICHQPIQDSIKLNLFMPPLAHIYANDTEGCDEVNAEFGFDYDPYDYALTGVNWNLFFNHYDGVNPVVHFDYSADLLAGLELTFANGCTFEYIDTVRIDVFPKPEANFYYNPDPALQYELTELIDISHGNPVAWEWYVENQFISTDERTTHVFEDLGNFAVMMVVTNEYGCSDTAHHLVEVIGDYTVYVPNAFTPDGNGVNNSFKPVMTNVKPDNYEFLIFNRWGEIVFRATSLDASWDGDYNGIVVEDGVYVYQIHVTDNRDIEHEYRGHVTLLK